MFDYAVSPAPIRRYWTGQAWPVLVLFVFLALMPVLASAMNSEFVVRLFLRAIILALAAIGLNLVLGFGGMVSLMHSAFFGVSAYVVAILAHHEINGDTVLGLQGTSDLAIAAPLALIVACIAATLVGLFVLRTRGLYFIMMTLAFNQMLFYFMIALQEYGGEDGIQIYQGLTFAGQPVGSSTSFYYIVLVCLLLVVLALGRAVESRFGMILRAIAQNEQRIVALGISPLPYKLVAFVISAAIAGLAGVLWATSQGYVSPADLSWVRSADLIVIAVLGGMTRVWAPILGALVFVVAEVAFSTFTIYWQLFLGLGIVAVVVFLSDGLVSLWNALVRESKGGAS